MADWQTFIAWIIVVAAAAWMARRVTSYVINGLRGQAPGGGVCGGCAGNRDTVENKPLVTLENTNLRK